MSPLRGQSMQEPAPALLQRQNLAPLVLVNMGVGTHAVVWFMVVTAMPSVVEDLQAEPFLSWATSIYLVATIVGGAMMALLKGRLGGRRAMLASGIVVTAGGLLAAAAPGITLVLAGRVLQGLGEGVLVALSYALVRELFDIRIVPRVFGIQAVTWGFAIFLGPMAGGWLTEAWSWRGAFVGTAMLPLPLLVLAGWVLPDTQARRAGASTPVPGLRLLLLILGVMAIAVANRLPGVWPGFAAVALGFGLIAAMLRIDRHAERHMFPTVFPGLVHPVALGLWVLLLMPLAQMAIYVYTPYILQLHRGLSPTWAGYLGAVHAVAWSVAAVAVAPLSAAAQRRALQCGPLLLALGLAALAVTLPAQPLTWVVAAMLLIGTGFGTSYAFLNQRVMAAAQAGQEDATAGAAPTLGALGGAVGAALAGLAGNGLGLDQVLTATSVTQASRVLAGAGALLALVAALLVRRLLQRAG
ncbi:MAG: MFS transporter [Rhodoferax sp.]|nr:MFS transporter [Rhodoferax sp.]